MELDNNYIQPSTKKYGLMNRCLLINTNHGYTWGSQPIRGSPQRYVYLSIGIPHTVPEAAVRSRQALQASREAHCWDPAEVHKD